METLCLDDSQTDHNIDLDITDIVMSSRESCQLDMIINYKRVKVFAKQSYQCCNFLISHAFSSLVMQ